MSKRVTLWLLTAAAVACCYGLFFTPKYPYLLVLAPVVFGLIAFMPVPGAGK